MIANMKSNLGYLSMALLAQQSFAQITEIKHPGIHVTADQIEEYKGNALSGKCSVTVSQAKIDLAGS